MRRLLRLIPIAGLLASVGVVSVMANEYQYTFDPGGLDSFETYGVFKIVLLGGTPFSMEGIELKDTNTVVGRSNSYPENDQEDADAEIIGWDSEEHAGTAQFIPDACVFPPGVPEGPSDTRLEVHAEILSMELTNPASTIVVRAGTKYANSPSGSPAVEFFYRDSTGEIVSKDPSGTDDFPAHSFFNVFTEIRFMGGWYYNLTPMIVNAFEIDRFPPLVDFPTGTYIHDPTFPAVPFYDVDGIHRGYLTSAGHGGPNTTTQLPDVGEAGVMVGPTGTVTFSVDNQSEGLSPSNPNHVRVDAGDVVQQRTTYESPGSDITNTRDLIFAGADGDTLNSISFGQDGTGPNRGTLVFSVGRGSEGKECTDVWYNSTFPKLPRPAAPLYASGVPRFGAASGVPVDRPPTRSHFMIMDSTTNGLEPALGSEQEDNVISLELSDRQPTDDVYATFTGPTFEGGGRKATIYKWDHAFGSFEFGNLDEWATPSQLGLHTNDEINAIVVSTDLGDEALFSLAPGSPTLSAGGYSAAHVFYSNLGGSFTVFATADDLGLLGNTDDVDALDIFRSIPVGGTSEVLTDSPESATGADEASGSASDYTALTAMAAAGAVLVALAAGGWYVRRRWLR